MAKLPPAQPKGNGSPLPGGKLPKAKKKLGQKKSLINQLAGS